MLSCARALYLTRVFSLSLALAMSLTFPSSLCQMRSLLRAHGSEGHTDKGKEHAKSKRSVWMGPGVDVYVTSANTLPAVYTTRAHITAHDLRN